MAIKKIPTKDMSHEDWLKERKKGIGGSDVACVLGLNKYKSAFALYNEKKSEELEDFDNEAMRVGRDLEEYVASRFTELSGIKVRHENAILINEDFPFIRANVDRLCVGVKAGLECKTASTWNAKNFGKGEFPVNYYAQCVAYMAVTGLPDWYLAVLVMGKEFKVYKLTRDKDCDCPEWCECAVYVSDDEIESLVSACRDFWCEHIEKNVPPAVFNSNDDEAISSACNPDSGQEIDMTGYLDKLTELTDLKRQIDELTAQKKQLEGEIKMFMGDCGKGYADGYKVSFTKQSRTTYDVKRFIEDNPNIDLEPYKKVSESTRLTIKTIKEE